MSRLPFYNASATSNASVATPQSRIVGGAEVSPFEHNWVVLLYVGGSMCGGSLISSEWVLTAAHCTDGIAAGDMLAGVHRHQGAQGTWWDDNAGDTDCAETINIAEKFDHPSYSASTFENDVSLLRLAQQPACISSIDIPTLDDGSHSQGGETCTVAGWGHTSEGGSSSDVLKSVDLTLLSNAVCTNGNYGISSGELYSSMLCAAGPAAGGEDACQGDSGGPLWVKEGGIDFLAGVVSWGYGCAQPNSAGVYARVSSFLAWIEETSGAVIVPPSPPLSPLPPLPPPPPPSSCTDTDNGATDPYGDACDDYVGNAGWCGGFDDSDFSSNEMCCACDGGSTDDEPPFVSFLESLGVPAPIVDVLVAIFALIMDLFAGLFG
jgi:secreted trypsin-like serine protease